SMGRHCIAGDGRLVREIKIHRRQILRTTEHNDGEEMPKMKKFVSTLGLGLLLGCFGACGSDSGTPHSDGGGPDGGKSGGDGSGSSEVGHSALDVGNQSET